MARIDPDDAGRFFDDDLYHELDIFWDAEEPYADL